MKDGGPAFPCRVSNEHFTYPDTQYIGMSLRDWFAGQAMKGLIIDPANWHVTGDTTLGEAAYRLADAMLAARGQRDD